ncbi:MAG: glycoside hydrolase family 99-like domain-containing protein [Deltaproteobacteria bacterium]|nr:glycoside hydrolase family 99-like domain-containing protein [Deltaproteobacteria bacterium]
MNAADSAAPTPAPEVRAIAYYLPQFHPTPENDEWWGKGFTEWTNVVRARPLFTGHEQPHLPTELGFYDLRVPEVRKAQAELAREHGIHGFCYYYYSFGEKRLLERPLMEVLASGEPDFPFCICWANETWSRRWDGSEAQVLVAQDDSDEHYRGFIDEVMPILQDRRYIRVEGRPVLLVYRVGRMKDPAAIARHWRLRAEAEGLPGLYLCAVQSHDPNVDPRQVGFDAAVEFPPSPWHGRAIDPRTLPGLDPDFTGSVFDYQDLVSRYLQRETPAYRLLRGVMTDWDNTPRRGSSSFFFRGSTPRAYETWLRATASWTRAHNPPQERILFINAWNEWAEGAHLEPDQRHGRAWLEATSRGLARAEAWRAALELLRSGAPVSAEGLRPYLEDLEMALERVDRAGGRPGEPRTEFRAGVPQAQGRPASTDCVVHFDQFQGDEPRGRVELRSTDELRVKGWALSPKVEPVRCAAFVMLTSPNGERVFSAPLKARTRRPDVAFRNRNLDPKVTDFVGFEGRFGCAAVAPGEYRLSVTQVAQDRVVSGQSEHRIIVR